MTDTMTTIKPLDVDVPHVVENTIMRDIRDAEVRAEQAMLVQEVRTHGSISVMMVS